MIPIVPLQDAVYMAITSHAAMDKWQDIVVIGDNPDAREAPLVQLGLFYQFAETSTFDAEPIYSGTFQLRVFTPVSFGGTMKLAALLSDLDTAIRETPLAVPGWNIVVPEWCDSFTTQPARDETTGDPIRLGVLNYSITLEHNPT